MKITKVSYQKAYIIGPYLQEKVGFEAEINDFDHDKSKGELLDHLKSLADEWHRKSNPHLYQEGGPLPPPVSQTTPGPSVMPSIDYGELQKLEIAIDNASTLEEIREIKEKSWLAGLSKQWITKFNEINNGYPADFTAGLE